MLLANSRTLTLFCYTALLLTLASTAAATPEKRDHHELNRMMRKRQFDLSDVIGAAGKRQLDLGAVGAAAAPAEPSTSSTPAASTPSGSAAATSSTPSAAATSAPATTSDPATATDTSTSAPTDSSISDLSASSTPSSVLTSSTPSTSSTLPATSSTPTDTPSVTPTSAGKTHLSTSTNKSGGVVTATVIDSAGASSAPVSAASTSSAAKATKTTLVVLVAIAASVGGVFVIWTIIRKWKFKPSSDFEDRMQPIDWQPSGPDDRDIPGLHRNASTASHGSFHSAGHDALDPGYGATGHGQSSLQPLPDHDFTAGPTLAPVGGYADLARGPSPKPQMTERSGYESYGVPLHHTGAYDYNNGQY